MPMAIAAGGWQGDRRAVQGGGGRLTDSRGVASAAGGVVAVPGEGLLPVARRLDVHLLDLGPLQGAAGGWPSSSGATGFEPRLRTAGAELRRGVGFEPRGGSGLKPKGPASSSGAEVRPPGSVPPGLVLPAFGHQRGHVGAQRRPCCAADRRPLDWPCAGGRHPCPRADDGCIQEAGDLGIVRATRGPPGSAAVYIPADCARPGLGQLASRQPHDVQPGFCEQRDCQQARRLRRLLAHLGREGLLGQLGHAPASSQGDRRGCEGRGGGHGDFLRRLPDPSGEL